MLKDELAIATCRVSSFKQLESGSLDRQLNSVTQAAEYLKVTIPEDGLWSGSVSSKNGVNYNRKDLRAMLAYCEKNKNVKYLIVDEIDRFMRSIDEMFYYEVEFKNKVGVKVWYAEDPELNSDDPMTKLRRAMKAFEAEGSNAERQRKSIKGLKEAIINGRWPFQPKAGYRKGYINGIPEIDEKRGLPLREAMLSMVEYRATPTEALATLNKSSFISGGAKYKMDKFRAMCTHSFYAGVVEMDKQVKYRNENGLHQPLITMEQHLKLVEIFAKKKKSQSGPRKNGNPEYPLSNIVHCQNCDGQKNNRYVGFDVNNGKNKERVYHKYRCRSCGTYFTREDLHADISTYIGEYQMTEYGRSELAKALNAVWVARRKTAEVEKLSLARDITALQQLIGKRVDAAIQPENHSIKDDILRKIEEDKLRLAELEQQHNTYDTENLAEKERFIAFALEYAENMERHFIKLPKPRLLQCKQMLFPAGFWIDANKKVYTPELSVLTRLATNKKDLPNPEKSFVVRVRRL